MKERLNKEFIKMRIKWFSLVRITGLLLVLLYHYFQGVFPGGFIGVDIFFTFSGFLITALLIDCLLYTSPSPRDVEESRMPSSA